MKAASSINASSSDKAFGLSAGASSAASGQGSSGAGFLAMLDGMIQAGSAGQNSAGQNAGGQNAGTSDQGQNNAQGIAANVDPSTADENTGTQDEIAHAASSDKTLLTPVAAAAAPVLPNAIVSTPSVSQPIAAKTTTATTATSADDAALAALAVQAGMVPVAQALPAAVSASVVSDTAVTTSASVQAAAPIANLALTTAQASPSQPVSASTVQPVASTAVLADAPTIVAANKNSVTAADSTAENLQTAHQNDQQNSDSQQSAILSALFAQAPLQALPATVTISSAGSSSAKPVSGVASNGANAGIASVPGVGIPPTLSPPAAVGNGASISVSHVLLAATSEAAAAPSFGIAASTNANASAASASDSSDADEDDNAVSVAPIATGDPVKAETIASLFEAPTTTAKAEKTVDDTSGDKATGIATPSADIGTTGLTIVHQSTATGVTNSAAVTNNSSATAYATPAEQVSVAMSKAASTGAQSMTIALNPLELGKVEVKLDFAKDGSVQASVTAERPETLTLLKNDHSTLTQALHNAGLTTDSNSLSFNLRDGGSSQQQQGFGSASSYRSRSANAATDDTVSTGSTTTVQYAVTSGNGRLDVRV